MNEQELREQLGKMEMQIQSLLRQIRDIRAKTEKEEPNSHAPTFFDACKAEDDFVPGNGFKRD